MKKYIISIILLINTVCFGAIAPVLLTGTTNAIYNRGDFYLTYDLHVSGTGYFGAFSIETLYANDFYATNVFYPGILSKLLVTDGTGKVGGYTLSSEFNTTGGTLSIAPNSLSTNTMNLNELTELVENVAGSGGGFTNLTQMLDTSLTEVVTNHVVTYMWGTFTNRPTVQIDVFTEGTNNWVKPWWATEIKMMLRAGGGGGGSGARRTPSGTGLSGGGGGASGGYSEGVFLASNISNVVQVVVGQSGRGGAAVSTTSNGLQGGPTGNCWVFPYIRVGGGVGGGGGGLVNSSAGGGSASNRAIWPGANAPANTAGTAGVNGSDQVTISPAAGGGGGGISSDGLTAYAGGRGGWGASVFGNDGGWGGNIGGGGSINNNGNSGGNAHSYLIGGGGGGGGGASLTGNGGNGGDGGSWGAGGGGGGSIPELVGFSSGAGGNGGPGIIVIISR